MNNLTHSKQFLFVLMRFTGLQIVLFLFTIHFLSAESLWGQQQLNAKVNFNQGTISLTDVLTKIEKETEIKFTYSVQKIDIKQPLVIEQKQNSVLEILTDLSSQKGINYDVFNDRYIVLSPGKRYLKQEKASIIGTLMSENGQPLQFANVMLTNDDGDFIKGAITDEFGKFSLKDIATQKYVITISYIGYKNFSKKIDFKTPLDLGTITLKKDAQLLKETVIKAQRKIIKQEIDRLVVDVENSVLSSRLDALEVLKSTPGITVVNNKISIIGKSGVGILINGKKLKLQDEDLANYLQSISADDIKYIEVITIPPAQYEAEGNSGLINIVLKKTIKNSWNAQLRTGYRQQRFGTGVFSGTLNYNKNKLAVTASLFTTQGIYYQEQDDYAYFPETLWYTSSPLQNKFTRLNSRFDLTYQVTSKWSIGGQFIHNRSNLKVTDNPYLPVYEITTNKLVRYLKSTSSKMNQAPIFTALNINNSIKISEAINAVVNLDYFKYNNNDTRSYNGISIINQPYTKQYYAGQNTNLQQIENFSGSADFEQKTFWANLNYGTKITQSKSQNDISLFNSGLVDTPVVINNLQTNDFTYIERVQALYASGSRNLNDHWSIKAGIRLENTQTRSQSKNLKLDQPKDYLKLFPTLYLAYNANDFGTYSLSYNRRIGRPNFWELNPNILFINPFQTIKGNAFLQPSFSNTIEFSHSFKNLTGKLYANIEKDIFGQVPLADINTKNIVFVNENYINRQNIGFSQYHTFDKMNWWTSTNSINFNYSKSSFTLQQDHAPLYGRNLTLSTSNDFSIPTNDHWKMNISFRHHFRGTFLIFETLPKSDLSASIQYTSSNKNLKIGIYGNDLLKATADRLETTVNGVFQTARYYYDSRRIGISVNYNFGNKKITSKTIKAGNTDERNRTGN